MEVLRRRGGSVPGRITHAIVLSVFFSVIGLHGNERRRDDHGQENRCKN